MRNILGILILLPFITSCQIVAATTSVLGGSSACESSKKELTFPNIGTKKNIDVSFVIGSSTKSTKFDGRAVCEYKGSICGGGKWFNVWHGDQSIKDEIALPKGGELTFYPHGMCIKLGKFEDKCANGKCDPLDYYRFLLLIPDGLDRIERNGEELYLTSYLDGYDKVKGKELKEYGYNVKKFEIKLTD